MQGCSCSSTKNVPFDSTNDFVWSFLGNSSEAPSKRCLFLVAEKTTRQLGFRPLDLVGSSNNQPHKKRHRLYSVATFQNSNTNFAGNRTSNFTFHSVAHQWQADPFKIGVTVKYYHLNEFSKTTVFFAIKYTKKAKSY